VERPDTVLEIRDNGGMKKGGTVDRYTVITVHGSIFCVTPKGDIAIYSFPVKPEQRRETFGEVRLWETLSEIVRSAIIKEINL